MRGVGRARASAARAGQGIGVVKLCEESRLHVRSQAPGAAGAP